MRSEHRDGLLALVGLFGLVALAAATIGVGRLFDPVGAAAGVAAAIAIEATFLEYPSRLLAHWERRGVPVAAVCAVLGAGLVAVRAAPRLLGVVVWGLLTYLVLLGCVLLGVENPVAVLLRRAG